ncbi:hypothetical protein FS749_013127 [Ceratobasidium sp. UAMH 11750]|nr:hypothetical protein FS749_013127 [Ceratobasidium sp. UAMH 11750]
MSRFRFHAKYIKTLGAFREKIEVYNWESLISFSRATKPLLPNLVELTSLLHDPELFSLFLSPSTKRVTLYMSHSSTFSARLLKLIVHTCPRLRLLNFHPELHEPAHPDTTQNNLLRDFAFLSSFQDLHALICTPMILQSPVLELVAQLPCLEHLTVCPNYPGANWDPSRCQQLPTGLFPALESLTIELRSSHDAKWFWELIPLPNLKDLDLTVWPAIGNNKLQFIPTLCQASPRITSLQLSFHGLLGGEPHRISVEMFEHLAHLPLNQTFSLDSAMLDFEEPWVKVAGAWLHLKKISCLDQSARLSDLLFLSSNISELECIKCDLDPEHAARTVGYNSRLDGALVSYPDLTDLVIKQFQLKYLLQSPEYNLSDVAW